MPHPKITSISSLSNFSNLVAFGWNYGDIDNSAFNTLLQSIPKTSIYIYLAYSYQDYYIINRGIEGYEDDVNSVGTSFTSSINLPYGLTSSLTLGNSLNLTSVTFDSPLLIGYFNANTTYITNFTVTSPQVNLQEIDLNTLYTLSTFDVGDNLPALVTLGLSGNQLSSIDVSNQPLLTHLEINECTNLSGNPIVLTPSINYFIASSSNLTETQVNNILIYFDGIATGPPHTGLVYLDGTNSPPSGSGITAYDSLIAKGWDVRTA